MEKRKKKKKERKKKEQAASSWEDPRPIPWAMWFRPIFGDYPRERYSSS
jgi:hypothetical protein